MSERLTSTLDSVDPTLQGDNTISPEELSRQKFQTLTDISNEMALTRPEYLGMTLYGSVARGEATPSSDVDIYIFMRPDNKASEQDNPHIPVDQQMIRVDEGSKAGTIEFNAATTLDYKWNIGRMLDFRGIPKAHIDVLPLDKDIIQATTAELLENAKTFEDGDKSIGALVPRNIQGLFHVPVEYTELTAYRQQVVDMLKASPYGTTAWRMIRHKIVGFESGKDQKYRDSLPHRYLAKELSEV